MRSISPELQAHLESGATTTTWLLRIDPVNPEYPSIGATLLDRDVTYDDGDGQVTYKATIGMVPANLVTGLDMDTGNTEIQHLLPEVELPIAEADIKAGVYDFAWFTLYLVNYEDLSMGHMEMPSGHGQLGQMRLSDGLAFWTELTDLTKMLKQSIVEKDSRKCRAIFGSQPIGAGGGVVEQRFPCGKDVSSLWTGAQTVTSVGTENTLTLTASGLGQPEDVYVPGMLQWLTGDNVGRTCEVDSQSAAGLINLTYETQFPIQAGDTFKIRPDCSKWKDGHNGCSTWFGTEWVLHYRGEPDIPIADADAGNMPGAQLPPSAGGSGTHTTVIVDDTP